MAPGRTVMERRCSHGQEGSAAGMLMLVGGPAATPRIRQALPNGVQDTVGECPPVSFFAFASLRQFFTLYF